MGHLATQHSESQARLAGVEDTLKGIASKLEEQRGHIGVLQARTDEAVKGLDASVTELQSKTDGHDQSYQCLAEQLKDVNASFAALPSRIDEQLKLHHTLEEKVQET